MSHRSKSYEFHACQGYHENNIRNAKTSMFVIRFFAGQLIYYLFRKIQTKHCLKSVQKRSFFWSVFSRIWAEYGDLRSKSLYSVRIRENRTIKNFRIWTIFTQWKDIWKSGFQVYLPTRIQVEQKIFWVRIG